MNSAILAALACIASCLIGWALGYKQGSRYGRSVGWLERYYAELDAATKRAQRFAHLHPRQGGQFAAKEDGDK